MSCKNNCAGCGCGIHRDLRELIGVKPIRTFVDTKFVVDRPDLAAHVQLWPETRNLLTTVPSINVHPDELRPGDPWWPSPLNVKVAVGPLDV